MNKWTFNFLGILLLMAVSAFYMTTHENIFKKAGSLHLTGNANLKFSKANYTLFLKKLSSLDEVIVENELKKIHQIAEKISTTSISNNGDIMITLAKSIDNNIVLVVFKNQQVQMIQKVLKLSENKIEFQYGELVFSPESQKLAYSQNIELEF